MTRDKKSDPHSGFSRRDFFRGGTAGALGAGLFSRGLAEGSLLAAQLGLDGPGKTAFTLNVNGEDHQLEVEPRVTLLEALRDHLEITGAKRVCDRSSCGACTVLRDGQPVYGCTVLAIDAQGAKIETVESLGQPGNLHPLQQAFVDNDAQQCGFCTPGFVMACKAFLDRHPNPTPEQIQKELGGNLCRCGTYMGIRKAVLATAGKGGQHA